MIEYLNNLNPEHAGFLAVILGVILTFLTILSKLTDWITAAVFLYRKNQSKKRLTQNLLIVPSPEEIAKYSIKQTSTEDPEEAAYFREANLKDEATISLIIEMERFRARTRIILLAINFGLAFIAVASWYTFIAIK